MQHATPTRTIGNIWQLIYFDGAWQGQELGNPAGICWQHIHATSYFVA